MKLKIVTLSRASEYENKENCKNKRLLSLSAQSVIVLSYHDQAVAVADINRSNAIKKSCDIVED